MAKIEFIVFLLLKGVNCAFFDLTDVEDPLSLLWHNSKDFAITRQNSPCIVPVSGSSVIPGRCRHKTLCLLSGGQANSNNAQCGNYLTCCTASTVRSKRTKSKIAHFTKDEFNFVSDCEYIVELQDDNICQVRLDFEQFVLSPSTVFSVNDMFQRRCGNDYMTVTPDVYNIPHFCGNNAGQHAYVNVYNEKEVQLKIHLAKRNSGTSLPSASWRIRITQLECSSFKNLFTHYKSFGFGTDVSLLAPVGVTQYFTEPTGTIRSFGYNGVDSEYISGLHYVIGFKKTPNVNCIKFTTSYVKLRYTDVKNNGSKPNHCIDYLFIPQLQIITNDIQMYGSKICPDTGASQIFYSTAPGPFYIDFISQDSYTQNAGVHAFDIQYEITSC